MNGEIIKMVGAVYIFCGIFKCVVSSTMVAGLGALFLNAREGKILRITLNELGHNQSSTPVYRDSITAPGVANNTIKKQQ